ncbi:four helix bundle protein [Bacteroidota bacterium]
MKLLQLNDIKAYKIAFGLSNYVWDIVINWEWFSKKHLRWQFVEAIDSISANIAEDFGRYHKKDKIKSYRYSQGSLKEAFDWDEKSKVRKLITNEQYNNLTIE